MNIKTPNTKIPFHFWKHLKGARGRNNLFRLVVDPTGPYPWATYAEEWVERNYKLVRCAVPALVVAVLSIWRVGSVFVFPFVFLGVYYGIRSLLRQEIELLGNAVQSVVAERDYGYNIHDFMKEQAEQLSGYSQFKGMPVQQIEDGIREQLMNAKIWVRKFPPKPETYPKG